jgi:hypothetical protein
MRARPATHGVHSQACWWALLLVGCARPGGQPPSSETRTGTAITATAAPTALSPERIAEILASPDRSAADRTNDLRRKPAEMLAFIGVRPGSNVLDLSAGGATRPSCSHARSVSAAASTDRVRHATPPAPHRLRPRAPTAAGCWRFRADCGGSTSPPVQRRRPQALAATAHVGNGAGRARPQAVDLEHHGGRPALRRPGAGTLGHGALDLVTLMFNYHDLGHLGVDRAAMNAAVFAR